MIIVCAICSDLVAQAENIFATRCGHIFHHHCLAQWIERSETCPQCRNKVTEQCIFRLYPTVSSDNSDKGDDAAALQSWIDDAQLKLQEQKVIFMENVDNLIAGLKYLIRVNERIIKKYTYIINKLEELFNTDNQVNEKEKLQQDIKIIKQNIQILYGKISVSKFKMNKLTHQNVHEQILFALEKEYDGYLLRILRLEDRNSQLNHKLEQINRELELAKDIKITVKQRASLCSEILVKNGCSSFL